MARPGAQPCPVPGCKGCLEPGTRAGKALAWCRVCERRIQQLQQLHEKLAAMEEARPIARAGKSAADLSDAELLQVVAKQVVNMKDAAELAGRSMNVVSDAIVAGQLPAARIGRMLLLGRRTVTAWGNEWKRRGIMLPTTSQYLDNLPRVSDDAITADDFAARVHKRPAAVQQWLSAHKDNPRLKRRATLDARQNAVVLYWWDEAPAGVQPTRQVTRG